MWLKEKRKDVELKIILFLISPFFAFLYSLKRIKTKSSYLIFFLTAIFFGLSFTVESGKGDVNSALDGQFYREKFESYQYIISSDFWSGFINFLSFEDGKKDYYFDTLAFYITRFTDNYHIMFMLAATVFIYFALKSFRFLTAEDKFDASIISYILVYLFFYNQIFNINGFRFWTAAWIAVYCIFQIYRNGNRRYFLLALITPYFHGAYWIFLAILFIAHICKKFEKFWILLFVISFFASTIAVELIQNYYYYLPPFLSKLAEIYTSEEVLEKTWSGFGWLPMIFKNAISVYLTIIILLFIRHSNEIKSNPKTKNIYLLLLVWVSIFNFLMFVPSLGSRFIQISYPLIAYIWLVIFKDSRYQNLILFLPLVFFWDILKNILYYTQVLEYNFYYSSFLYLIYKYIIDF